jgi:hypothetical protein
MSKIVTAGQRRVVDLAAFEGWETAVKSVVIVVLVIPAHPRAADAKTASG